MIFDWFKSKRTLMDLYRYEAHRYAGIRSFIDAADSIEELRTWLTEEKQKEIPMVLAHSTVMEPVVQHWAVRVMAASFLDTLKQSGGENYVTMELVAPNGDPLSITIQRKLGKSLASELSELRKTMNGLVLGIQKWAAEEDGIPGELMAVFQKAKDLLKQIKSDSSSTLTTAKE